MNAEERLIALIEPIVGSGRVWAQVIPQHATGVQAVFTDVSGVVLGSPCGDAEIIDRVFQIDLYGPVRKALRDLAGLIVVALNAQPLMEVSSTYELEYDDESKWYRRIIQVQVEDQLAP